MTLVKAEGDNPNPLFEKQEISRPLVSEKAPLKGVELKDSYLYDVATGSRTDLYFYFKLSLILQEYFLI